MVAKTPAGAIAKFATLAAEYRDDPVDPGALTGNKPLTADHVLTSAARDCARLISSSAA